MNCVTLTHIRQSHVLYSVHLSKYQSLLETPSFTQSKIMFNQVVGHPVAQAN